MNTTRVPPQGRPSPTAFVSRLYARDLRPIVIVLSVLSALWALFSGIGFFQSVSADKHDNKSTLANASIALGAVFIFIAVIEFFGAAAVTMRRTALVRIYTMLTVVSAISAIGAALSQVVIHFIQKDNLINECKDFVTGDEVVYRFGFFGPTSHQVVDAQDAASWCQEAWDHDSVGSIVSLLIVILLAILFCSIAFAYYRQLLDPTSAANAFRAPSNQARANPSHYNPPYNASVPNLGYGAGAYGYNMPYAGDAPGYTAPRYAPPAGQPPAPSYDGKGYNVGLGSDDKAEDPFADFEGERDVTSRPAPGGPTHF